MRLRENSMLLLYLISGILGYAHKIPFIGRIITLLGLWYGKTTWWKILIKLRKIFIIFNALIGVYMVFKAVGFSTDNLVIGFMAMGETYFQIFINFTKRLFNWFFELFDHKIVPNVPGNSESTKTSNLPWNKLSKVTPTITESNLLPEFSLRELYAKNPIIVDTTPWYREWKTWLYLVGAAGAIYFGYKFIVDPLFISDLGKSNLVTGPVDPNIPPSPDITLSERLSKGISSTTKSLGSIISKVRSGLNPYNWLIPTTTADLNSQFNTFLEDQNNMATADLRLYPFTEVNPYAPWYKKLYSYFFSETVAEYRERMVFKNAAQQEMSNILDNKNQGLASGLQSVINSGYNSPAPWAPTQLGLGVRNVSGNPFLETVAATSSFANVSDKFMSIPSTPNTIPTVLPHLNISELDPIWHKIPIETTNVVASTPAEIATGDTLDVKTPTASKVVDGFSYAKKVATNLKGKNPIKVSENKFDVLELE